MSTPAEQMRAGLIPIDEAVLAAAREAEQRERDARRAERRARYTAQKADVARRKAEALAKRRAF
jgi:hypothetical protein